MERRSEMAVKATFETDGTRYRLVKVVSRKPYLVCGNPMIGGEGGEREVEVGSFISLEEIKSAHCEYTINYKPRR
jgi:hypothetical protein